jgi:hypothetical protein
MAPQVPGLFYSTKLQSSLAWWKQPLNFASKKVVHYIEQGVKGGVQKGSALCAETFGSEVC